MGWWSSVLSLNYVQLAENERKRYEHDDADENDTSPSIYDIITIPNDFNTKTIVDFIESDSFVIPDFQRNYVWNITHASKFIESIIIGLPIPQIFLYEKKTKQIFGNRRSTKTHVPILFCERKIS